MMKEANENSRIDLIIFSAKLRRKSKDCERGFSMCDFEWFPWWGDIVDLIDGESNPENGHALTAKETDSDGEFFILELEDPFPLDFPEDLKNYIIEEDLSTASEDGTEYHITAGVYEYDESISNFGGYKIYFN